LAEFLERAEYRERLMEQRIRDAARRKIQEAHELKARGLGVEPPDRTGSRGNESESFDPKIIKILPTETAAEIGDVPLQTFGEF
jgi:hypothetical protein